MVLLNLLLLCRADGVNEYRPRLTKKPRCFSCVVKRQDTTPTATVQPFSKGIDHRSGRGMAQPRVVPRVGPHGAARSHEKRQRSPKGNRPTASRSMTTKACLDRVELSLYG